MRVVFDLGAAKLGKETQQARKKVAAVNVTSAFRLGTLASAGIRAPHRRADAVSCVPLARLYQSHQQVVQGLQRHTCVPVACQNSV